MDKQQICGYFRSIEAYNDDGHIKDIYFLVNNIFSAKELAMISAAIDQEYDADMYDEDELDNETPLEFMQDLAADHGYRVVYVD